MTFSLLQSNYRRNLPTELLDYQLLHIHRQSELDTEHSHNYRHTSPLRKINYSQIRCRQ